MFVCALTLLSFEELDGPLVFFGGCSRLEGAEISPLAGFRILFQRVEAVLTALQFADHVTLLPQEARKFERPFVVMLANPSFGVSKRRSIRYRSAALIAALVLANACSNDVAPSGPPVLSVTAGDGQTAVAATELPAQIVVELRDAKQRPMGGITVTWTPRQTGHDSVIPAALRDT
jgi:hypothetical protein